MSYLVLARKYRPKNFGEMVGQEHVVRALSNALDSQRLHHAYLFTGTRGVGKTTVARILAKSLNCLGADGNGGITSTPCGVCQACTDIDSGRFIDYTELDAASNRGIDDVQTLLEQAVYKPVQGRFKVFMIDEVHMLTTAAFNAMLKTLEEPPDYLKFVLATTDPQKVPVTVLSRCLQFNLRPMAPETVREHLTRVLQSESVAVDPQALRLLSRAARGSMRDALSLTDQAIAFGAGQLSEAVVHQMLGSVDRGYVLRLIEALAHGDGKTMVETVEDLRLHGLSPASMLEEMSAMLQRMAVLQAVPDSGDAADPDALDIARLAGLMPADETQLLYSLCLHGAGELGLAPDEYAALTMVLLRLLAFKPATTATPRQEKKTLIDSGPALAARTSPSPLAVSTAAPVATAPAVPAAAAPAALAGADAVPQAAAAPEISVAAVARAPGRADAVPVAAQLPAAPQRPPLPAGRVLSVVRSGASREAAPAATDAADAARERVLAVPVRVQADNRGDTAAQSGAVPTLVPTEEGDFWYATVQQLVGEQAITALARELALQSQLVARDTDQWVLRVERESLQQPGSRDRLVAALASIGHAVTLVVEIGRVTDSPARRNTAFAAEKQLAAEKLIFDDPFVQKMMRDFGAKIVTGSIRPV
ncbi:MAG: DNA polymerase III subunit gamma/tau [Rhodoferax sp.]|nr:DNA polymerase III subunit gamma/tau [Rhodoferax sp.]HQZ06541.1 DNA polymerase III subunit gamma/tau [Burkholderiaceae bacterium]